MKTVLSILLFAISLAVTLAAARTFARRLDRLGTRLGFSEALIGLLTALAADGPELSSAIFALARGDHDVGVGVLVGSNTFNLATMIGISALLAASVRPARATLAVEGSVGVAITLIAIALLRGWLSSGIATLLAAVVLVPYLAWALRSRRPPPGDAPAPPTAPAAESRDDPMRHLVGFIALDVLLIVAGSSGMVQAALNLGHYWHISMPVLGVVALGPLTSLPNAMTGIRLGIARRGEALVGEAFNSNTINLAGGVIIPALFVTLAAASSIGRLELWWLLGMTGVTVALLANRHGLGRVGGILLIALYAGFLGIALS
jgi:cation:H+ antiporter